MLRVDLGQLGREGSVTVEASVSAEDEIWAGTELRWAGDVSVKLRATFAGTGEIVVRGRVDGILRQECRRCLEPLETAVSNELTMVFVESGSDEEGEDDAYRFDPNLGDLDLSDAVREELVLAVNPYVVCDPKCEGLCPRCGANLNDGLCECTEEELDPRWGALRNLKSE